METYIIISISLVLLIIIYWVFLVYIKSNKNIEGFEDEIKKLIDFTKTKSFSTKIWDNYSYLSGIYLEKKLPLPANFNECLTSTGMNNAPTNCPISIWRPNKEPGYNLIGDVMTRLFVSPNNETIKDIRVAKTPGAITDKNLDTVCVLGSELKEPEDYIYVGGFGNGVMINMLEQNDKYLRLQKIIKTNFNKIVEQQNQIIYGSSNNTGTGGIKGIINSGNLLNKDFFAEQLHKISKSYSVQPLNQDTINNFNEIYDAYTPGPGFFNQNEKNNCVLFINRLRIQQLTPINNNTIRYEIKKNILTISNPYSLKYLFSKISIDISNDIEKIFKTESIFDKIEFTYYTFKISNINIIPNVLTPENSNQNEVTVIYKPDKLHIIGVENGYSLGKYINGHYHNKYNRGKARKTKREDDNYYFHSKLPIIKDRSFNTQINLNYLYKYRDNSPVNIIARILYNDKWPIIDIDKNISGHPNLEKTILSFHKSKEQWVHPQILDIYSIEYSINQDILDTILDKISGKDTTLAQSTNILNAYLILLDEIKSFAETSGILADHNYRALSVWQPIPPPGYVALGCVFLNSDKTVKPPTDLIMCIPQNCAKSFKRRPWLPEDLIFKYEKLSFYRNPYLGTVVVIDESKYSGQTPDKMKYRNDPKSPNWECFDIVPCIKESDYVSNLETGFIKSKKMCKSYQGLESKSAEKKEQIKTFKKEEERIKKMLNDKKNYINDLMNSLNTMMSNEELYKMINTGINRHKMQTDLEKQRKVHEAVSDKLMRTRGLEISWDNTEELGQFKNILQRFVVAKGINNNIPTSQESQDCPVCQLPDTSDMVQLKDLKMCYGCVEDVVRELIGAKRAAGEEIPPELQELEDKMAK